MNRMERYNGLTTEEKSMRIDLIQAVLANRLNEHKKKKLSEKKIEGKGESLKMYESDEYRKSQCQVTFQALAYKLKRSAINAWGEEFLECIEELNLHEYIKPNTTVMEASYKAMQDLNVIVQANAPVIIARMKRFKQY